MSQMYVVECLLDKEPRARKHRVARWIVSARSGSNAIVKAAAASYKARAAACGLTLHSSPNEGELTNELAHGIWSAKPVGDAMHLETISR